MPDTSFLRSVFLFASTFEKKNGSGDEQEINQTAENQIGQFFEDGFGVGDEIAVEIENDESKRFAYEVSDRNSSQHERGST